MSQFELNLSLADFFLLLSSPLQRLAASRKSFSFYFFASLRFRHARSKLDRVLRINWIISTDY
jgi:hypothetical protein